MKVYSKKTETKIREVLDHIVCDCCKLEYNIDRKIAGGNYGETFYKFESDHIKIRRVVQSATEWANSYEGGSDCHKWDFDICALCFESVILKALELEGVNIKGKYDSN